MMKNKTRQNKKMVREDYQWTGEEINFADSVNNFCRDLLFPKYKFLKEGWQEYLPEKKNSLYSLCMQHLKIPEGLEKGDIWEGVIVPSIKMKYVNIKGNMNNDLKRIYESRKNTLLHNQYCTAYPDSTNKHSYSHHKHTQAIRTL
jgi:hypothetical protein